MYLKNIHIQALACLFLLTVFSCEKEFLNEEVLDVYAPETLTDEPGFEASLIGLYNHMSTLYTHSGPQGWPSVWQVGTDITWPTQPQGIETPYYDYNQLTADSEAAAYTWSWAYRMINNTNIIIQNIESEGVTGIAEERRNVINAEARFFRGLAYHTLATAFGGVPLLTEPLTGPRTDFFRASLEEINDLIEADLLFAADQLPLITDRTNEYSRANRHMANHLLSEFYLRTGDNAAAEAQADMVIESGLFSLVSERYGVKAGEAGTPFADMFYYGNQRRSQGNTEGIWVLEAENPRDVVGGQTNNPQQRRVWGASYHQKFGMVIADSLGGRGIARMRLNNYVLYNLYPEGDMRNSRHSIHRQFYYNDPEIDSLYGQPVPYEGPDTVYIIPPYTLKWGHFDPQDLFGFGMWKDFILMRLGETYLFRAEAEFRQGKLEEAAETINILRERANAPLVEAADIDLDFILDERIRELLAEENRRFTLMRTGTLVDRAYAHNGTNPIEQYQLRGLTETHLLLPIPQREIDLNKDAELIQNPGYQ
ncbi:RagB/SusD family nutrient uptake outer membrane protein [Lewinella sp. IMCC34191]|uniref:RagB/SusD family nutrient uptake outer membrane protein n=1 Tax=Lewinella sp. IMCC34191 TaxID=2259172 RepID=UPI000E28618E|nr:RagB/SusD family nutrient uptake outer membrane protein [Lewinella sp. IMCC34191]